MYPIALIVFTVLFAVIQIVLCLKCSHRFPKFIPLILCVLAAAVCFITGFYAESGWIRAGLWLLGVGCVVPICACGIGWLIAFLINRAISSM